MKESGTDITEEFTVGIDIAHGWITSGVGDKVAVNAFDERLYFANEKNK